MRVYAIGDIHGCLEKLRAAHELIAADGGAAAQVVHVGDLIDTGPDSAGVVRFLMRGQDEGRDWVVIKGNHDRQLPNFLRDPRWIDPRASDRKPWTERDSGAGAALLSWGIEDATTRPLDEVHAEALRKIPHDHARWLDGLPIWHLTPLALFVHAGIRPGVDLRAQIEDDLLWLRKPFMDDPRDHGVLVVHGHTPVRTPEHHGNRLNIDTGAKDGGPLSAVRLDRDGAWLLTGNGPDLIEPPRAG
ncbi:metallophosphoesterase [Paracoccus sp. Z118]|uniref:metallophosphoesterase n=1 Tax=Paracoccus sp. Z118 TaxID=2851017 RepID=UPI001C2BA07B|nr:metallophosphoesterase [Paracoccus sp. Z118]MBV0892672.1 metallophosphoesterase [Paracoccus sp. Z118]